MRPWLNSKKAEAMGAKWRVYSELAAAGLWTTSSDLATFAIEVQKSFHSQANTVLLRNMIKEMLSPVGGGDWAVGFRMAKGGRGWHFGHWGRNWGFRSFLSGHEVEGSGFVVMTNSENGDIFVRVLSKRIYRVYGYDSIEKSRV